MKTPHRYRFSRTVRPNLLISWLARQALRLVGWRIEGQPPELKKFVVIGAPHTSNWDTAIMIAAGLYYGVRIHWLGKETLFKKPWGRLLMWLGGVPTRRGTNENAVDQAAAAFAGSESFVLVVAPEGTRGKASYWKTGFYYIAHAAQVPILFAYIDYRRKVVGVSPELLYPSGDIEADFAVIREFYSKVTPKFPAKMGQIEVRPRQEQAQD
ncbi:MAG TPA: lysophospholipid acyltransferase family protein [Herpetosiphonaceae bacterium]